MNNDLPASVRADWIADVAAERKALEAEAEYLNETATDRFEASGWERSVTLDCGCHVRIERCDDGMESWWTERRWTLCDSHLHLEDLL